MPYKVAIDALCRMHDTGIVVRFGRKYSATWALAGTPADQPYDGVGALEAAWRVPPHPGGGGGARHPRPSSIMIGPSLKIFFGGELKK